MPAAVAQVLETMYEPLLGHCSYGFRPRRNTIQALRHVAQAYRAGATWIIEGDLVKCFDSIPHGVILNCLRKRIKDEQCIALVGQMLKAGVMEQGHVMPTYSGTPQGGLAAPILSNIVLHALDGWLEDYWQANPPPLTAKQQQARTHPEYARHKRNLVRWRAQLHGRIPIGRQTPEGLRAKIQHALAARKRIPSVAPRRMLSYCRYADDYLVVLCQHTKAEAQHLKAAMAQWLEEHLGLTQHPEKTHLTHGDKRFRFLGYDLRGQRNPNGTRWLQLSIPPEQEREVKAKVKRLCGYTQIPALDLCMSVNALGAIRRAPLHRGRGDASGVRQHTRKRDRRGHRRLTGQRGLSGPRAGRQSTRGRSRRHGTPLPRSARSHAPPCRLVAQDQPAYRGLGADARVARTLPQRNRVPWVMARARVHILAHQRRRSGRAVSRRDQRTLPPDPGPRGGRQVPVERQAGKRPLLARWGGISRSQTRQVILHDAPRRSGGPRPALAARLLADPGARCSAQAAVPVHHVRALQALRREGQAERPFAVTVMAARQRQPWGVCRRCHRPRPRGQPTPRDTAAEATLASRVRREAYARFGGGRMAKDPRWQLASRLPYFVGAFEDQADATAFYTALGERLGTFKLALAAETTRIIACPRQQSQTSFEFLGFECR